MEGDRSKFSTQFTSLGIGVAKKHATKQLIMNITSRSQEDKLNCIGKQNSAFDIKIK